MRIVAILSLVVISSSATIAAEEFEDLIRDVEGNERLYDNLQLSLTKLYDLAANVAVTYSVDEQEYITSEHRLSISLNTGQFRRHETGIHYTLLEKGSTEVIDAFDGDSHLHFYKYTSENVMTGEQLRTQSAGQISDEPPSLTNLARPHMFLLESGCPKVPLSTYLKGREAVLAHPNPSFVSGGDIEVQLLGVAEFQELECVRILIDTVINGVPYNGWELWLAPERNLIPVRKVAYTYRWSNDVPLAESTVDEWKEIRPDIWFPIKAHTDAYDFRTVQEEGKTKLRWRKQYDVESVSLEPKTNPATFNELEFPAGTKLRTIKDGVVVR